MPSDLAKVEPREVAAPQNPTEIERSAGRTLMQFVTKYQRSIETVLPKGFNPQRFLWLAAQQIRLNPALAGVTPLSFLNSVILASQMGLEIRRDSAYLIPFGKQCQLLIDYKGKLDLARRSGKVGGIQAVTVRERDELHYGVGVNGWEFSHKPYRNGKLISSPEERGLMVGVYAFAELNAGGLQWREPMSLSEIDRIRKRSRAGAASLSLAEIFAAQEIEQESGLAVWQSWEFRDKRRVPWVTDFEPMALKTALHSLCKGLPLDQAGQISQEVDEGLDTGKQPEPLSVVDIDPADNRPLIETSESHEAHEELREDRAKRAEQEGKWKPLKKQPTHIQQIMFFRQKISESQWWSVLGANAFDAENFEEMTPAQAAKIAPQMQELVPTE